MSNVDCDIAVIGGGPAGATAALTLAEAGYKVTLVEGSLYERPRVGETIPPSARPLLTRLGLWEALADLGSTPSFGNQSAWGGPDLLSNPFIFNPHGNGWHVDRQRFDPLLAGKAAIKGARFVSQRQVTKCVLEPEGLWRLRLSDDEEIVARAVIEATGRRAALARRLGAKRRIWDHLVGVAVEYHGESSGYTLVEAAADGWWYSAPLPTGRTIVMFMTDADLCRSQRRADQNVWKQGLNQTQYTRERVAGQEPIRGPGVFSAVSHRLERVELKSRWLACGDAAIGVDPLSSSGILRALQTGEAVGHAMDNWLRENPDAAYAYERWLDDLFVDYWLERQAYYALETRWPNSPFWQRRIMPGIGSMRNRNRRDMHRVV